MEISWVEFESEPCRFPSWLERLHTLPVVLLPSMTNIWMQENNRCQLIASITKYIKSIYQSISKYFVQVLLRTFKDSGRTAYLVIMFSMGFGQLRIGGGRVPWCTAHMIRKAGPPISSNGLRLVKTSHRIIPQLNTSHFSLYTLPVINTKHEFLQYVKTIYQY